MFASKCLLVAALVGSVLADPAATAFTVPAASTIGPVQVLLQNDLGPANDGTAAVLLYKTQSYTASAATCKQIGESLLPLEFAPKQNQTDIASQLDYLVSKGSISKSALIWVSNTALTKRSKFSPRDAAAAANTTASTSGTCTAYVYSTKKYVQMPCSNSYAALCTSTPGPFTTNNMAVQPKSKITLTANDYTLTGYRDGRSFRFLGIPFAAPPVGNLRFAAPAPYTGSKTLTTTSYGFACIQAPSAYGSPNGDNTSEDCLTLNIYTPYLPNGKGPANLPVGFWIYGGAYLEGSNRLPDYDGGNFASRSDVVIVTINYRVGALGGLATSSILNGNYATQDQIAALKWVSQHISAFGGDPSKITIFGQSAGAQSVTAVLSSSAAKGLFRGAIAQSAPIDLPFYTRDVYTQIITPSIATAVGCGAQNALGEQQLVACLRSVSASSFTGNGTAASIAMDANAAEIAARYEHSGVILATIEPFLPILSDIGDGVIDDQFQKLIVNGNLPNKVPLMMGTVEEEATIFVDGVLTTNPGNTQAAYVAGLNVAYPSQEALQMVASGQFNVNSTDPDGARDGLGTALTNSEWLCPTNYLLRNQKGLPAVYQYIIRGGQPQASPSPGSCGPNSNFNATCHASDVLLVFGTLNTKFNGTYPYFNANQIAKSQMFNDIWGSFIRTLSPNVATSYLQTRGRGYTNTLAVFGKGYALPPHSASNNVALLDYPPFNEGQQMLGQCGFFDTYQYTFQKAAFT